MKVLLIGKYPPLQGGVSSRTYWLYKHLEKRGFEFKIVTLQDERYSVQGIDDDSNVVIVKEKQIPWHLPTTTLLADRLINSSIKVADSFDPDIIETNYLWPFGNAGLTISKMTKKPLLIRHAGSDIQKFHADNEFREIMSFYFRNASIVVTNVTSRQLVEEIASDSERVLCVPRYIPDPEFFRRDDIGKAYEILFAGKINYHWNRKGIMLLLEVIGKRKLKALFHIGGKYVHEVLDLISSKGLDGYISVSSFVTPEKMPCLYNASRYVWCWEDEGTIDDFSNVIWESIFCGVPCIINDRMSSKPETTDIMRIFPRLIYSFSSDNIIDFDFRNETIHLSDTNAVKSNLFDEYIKTNIGVYKEVLKRS